MALDLNPDATGTLIEDLIKADDSPIKDVTVFWGGATLPTPLPERFIVIEPLFPTEWRSWGEQRNATHTVQVRASGTTRGASSSLRSQVANLLPPDVIGTIFYGPTLKIGKYFDSILTARSIAGERESP